MPMRYGIAVELEAIADGLIKESLRGVTRYSDKSDILTPWKQQMRRSREVLTSTGTADPSIRQGMYNRAVNTTKPHLNSRDGLASGGAHRTGSRMPDSDHTPVRINSSLLGFVNGDE